jgi:ribose-phosphate pyrophosphokinase
MALSRRIEIESASEPPVGLLLSARAGARRTRLRHALRELGRAAAPVVDRAAGRRRVRVHEETLALFSGRSHPLLAECIAGHLGVELGEVELATFQNGESYCRYRESIRGADVFIVQSCAPPVNDHLVELLLMIEAARLASAHRVTAVMPWYPYSRQDRKAASREPVSARLVADVLEAAGADRIVTVDLHAGQIQGFFSVPVDHATALPLFARHLVSRGLRGDSVVAVAPDLGRVKLARRLSRLLDCNVAVVSKSRPRPEAAAAGELIGRVRGRTAILGDDMIVTGGTIAAATRALLEAGASDVIAFATHGLFPGDALERLTASELSEILVTDSVPLERTAPKLTVLSLAPLLADTIDAVFASRSVSGIFAGQEAF